MTAKLNLTIDALHWEEVRRTCNLAKFAGADVNVWDVISDRHQSFKSLQQDGVNFCKLER